MALIRWLLYIIMRVVYKIAYLVRRTVALDGHPDYLQDERVGKWVKGARPRRRRWRRRRESASGTHQLLVLGRVARGRSHDRRMEGEMLKQSRNLEFHFPFPFQMTSLFSVARSKAEEFPAKMVKFPQSFPTIFKIPNFLLENSQCGFLLHFY